MRKRSAVATLTTVSAIVAAALAAPSAGATPPPSAIPNTVPAWTHSARALGAASSAATIDARVYLSPRGGFQKLVRDVMAVSTPGSAGYRHFLTAAQYHAAYDPSTASVAAVKSWLADYGLKVTGVAAHNDYVAVRGTVAAAERAFSTSIGRFVKAGKAQQAPTTPVHVPAELSSAVLTVTGLNTVHAVARPLHSTPQVQPPAGFRNARPCSTYYGQVTAKYQADFKTKLPKYQGRYLPYAPCGYTGPQFRAAYERNSTLDGSGVTVAITDAYAAPTIRFDAQHYAQRHGDGSYRPGQYQQVIAKPFRHQTECGPSGWAGEETLDVEAVHAMAPAANILYYGGRSCFDDDLLAVLTRVVNDNRAQLVTNSWGDVEEAESAEGVRAYEKVFLQGAMQGISFMFSSGDNGDELQASGLRQADYPTSDPYVTSVGGTSTAIGADGSFRFNTGWGTEKYALSSGNWAPQGYLYGAGGGRSSLFNRPSYQDGIVAGAHRSVPDVAMDADPTTGMLVGETQTFPNGVRYEEYRIGGTSLASPLLAGFTALALQKSGGHGVGLLNPTIYGNARNGTFADVKGASPDPGNVRVDYANTVNPKGGLLYSIRTFNQDSSLSVKAGWDDVTGLGVPTPTWLKAVASA